LLGLAAGFVLTAAAAVWTGNRVSDKSGDPPVAQRM